MRFAALVAAIVRIVLSWNMQLPKIDRLFDVREKNFGRHSSRSGNDQGEGETEWMMGYSVTSA